MLLAIKVIAPTLLVAGVLSGIGAPAFPDAVARAGALPGGRLFASGPFLFYATLYADPRLQSPAHASAAWLASDVPGVGVRLLWLYRGRAPLGPVDERYAPLGVTGCVGAGYSALQPGERGGRDGGGLFVPAGVRSGRRAGFALVLDTPRGSYGVVIRYTLWVRARGPTVGRVVVSTAGTSAVPTNC